jgi:hypothetical protein
MSRYDRRPEPPRMSLGWKLWFAFCALLSLGVLLLLVGLVTAAIDWLGRH